MPSDLHQRLALEDHDLQVARELQKPGHEPASDLARRACEIAPQEPERGLLTLAAAMVSKADHTADGRLSAALILLAPLVADSDPYVVLGPQGDGPIIREHALPAGWPATIQSWEKLRFAWREGLQELLRIDADDERSVAALNQLTRLHPGEEEPIRVAIKETYKMGGAEKALAWGGAILTMKGLFDLVYGDS